MQIFSDYSWPGNVRELKNVTESMVLLSAGDVINEEAIPQDLFRELDGREEMRAIPLRGTVTAHSGDEKRRDRVIPLNEIEKNAIIEALKITDNNKTKAAKLLGIGVRTLYRKIKEYEIR
jgi:two-component system response regulator HydG